MPEYTVNLMIDSLNEHQKAINGTTIGLLGLSYKANVGDLRESPSLEIMKILKKKGANVIAYDPYIKSDCRDLNEFQDKCQYIILATNHKEFKDMDLSKVKILIDGKNMFYGHKMSITYKGIGR